MKGRQPQECWRIFDQGSNHATIPLKNFMSYRNDPVVRQGPFNVVVAFCLEVNVVYTSRLQTKAGVTSLERGLSRDLIWACSACRPPSEGCLPVPPQFLRCGLLTFLRVPWKSTLMQKHFPEVLQFLQTPFSFSYPTEIKCGFWFQNCKHDMLILIKLFFPCCPARPSSCVCALNGIWNDIPKGVLFLGSGIWGFPFFKTNFFFIHFILFLKCIGIYDVYQKKKTHTFLKKLFLLTLHTWRMYIIYLDNFLADSSKVLCSNKASRLWQFSNRGK